MEDVGPLLPYPPHHVLYRHHHSDRDCDVLGAGTLLVHRQLVHLDSLVLLDPLLPFLYSDQGEGIAWETDSGDKGPQKGSDERQSDKVS